MASPRHSDCAARFGREPSRCEDKLRRVHIRAGSGGYYVPIGLICDLCGTGSLDRRKRT
jgi:hypothetical protein